jgi:hypothetical protein
MGPDGKGGVNLVGIVSVYPQVEPDNLCGRWERKIYIEAGTGGIARAVANG